MAVKPGALTTGPHFGVFFEKIYLIDVCEWNFRQEVEMGVPLGRQKLLPGRPMERLLKQSKGGVPAVRGREKEGGRKEGEEVWKECNTWKMTAVERTKPDDSCTPGLAPIAGTAGKS